MLMKNRLTPLQTKLTVSKASHTLRRARLEDALKAVSQKKLGLVVAGAGYGKTTLVAQTVAEMAADTLWYSLDESDQDFAVFLGYLVIGVRRHMPAFGKTLDEKLAVPSVSPRNRKRVLLAFLGEIETHVRKDMFIVLDDYHLVQDCPEIAETLEFLLARMPPQLHLVLISRTDPPLRISRYRTMLAVVELGEADLSFRIEEIDTLYRDLFALDIHAAHIRKLFDKTGGWAAGLILFYTAWQGGAPTDRYERLFDIGRSKKLIDQYLEENVFERQSEDIRQFMVQSSLLDRMDPNVCDLLLERRNSRDILTDLCENHLFTLPCGDSGDCYQYHHLLRGFLREKLVRMEGDAAVTRRHFELGTFMEERGDRQGAIHHFLAGGHFEAVCRIVTGMMVMDFLDCPFRFLVTAVDRIPPEFMRTNARLRYVGAKLASLKGDVRLAIHGFQTALDQFRAEGDAKGVSSCLKDLGFHYYLRGDVIRAKQQMDDLWGKPHDDPFFQMEVAGYLVLFSAILGEMDGADRYYEAIRKSTAGAPTAEKQLLMAWMDLCYCNRFYHSGDFDRAHGMNMKAMDTFVRMEVGLFLPLAHFQAALMSFYRAAPATGVAHAETGLGLAAENGIFDHQYAWLLYARALNGQETGVLEQARLDAEEALAIFEDHGNFWGQATVCELCSAMALRHRRWDEAEGFIRRGRQVIDGLGLSFTQGALALRQAGLLVAREQWVEAASFLEKHSQEMGLSKFHRFQACLLSVRVHTGCGAGDSALSAMKAGLAMAEENHYDAWLARLSRRLLPALARCYARGVKPAYIEKILLGAGLKAGEVLESLKFEKKRQTRDAAMALMAMLPRETPAPLRIQCLGEFRVFRGDREIPRTQWRSAKATKLFKYMLMRRDKGFIPKEVLLELVWPDEDAGKTNRRFHVALTTLRKLLEPDLKRGVPSAYIIRRNDAYRLKIGEAGRVDFQEFLTALALADRMEETDADDALDQFLVAEARGRGILFEEDPYEDWFMEDREMLKNKYLHTLSRIIHLNEAAGCWQRCAEYAEKYLVVDPYVEPVYRDLMRYYFSLGQTTRVMKTFNRCRACITETMECALSPGTMALYRELTGTSEIPAASL